MTPLPVERGPQLVPPQLRRPAALLALACTAVLVVLAARYHGDRAAGRLDNWVFGQIPEVLRSHHWTLTGLAKYLPIVLVVVAGVVAVASGIRRRWNVAALAVLAPAATVGLTELGKQLVDRRIDGYLALPSGHTAGATSVFLVLGLVWLSRVRHRLRAVAVLVAAAVTAGGALVGLLMVSVHDHYATDTVAGYCIAVAVTLAIALAIDSGHRRLRWRSAPPSRKKATASSTVLMR
jgi:undecaprenyl-diphosphatase